MLKRPLFWGGLLMGALAAWGPRKRWLPKLAQRFPTGLLDLVDDAVFVCDAFGNVTYANAAAALLCGSDFASLSRLCYPSGQRVPPGQLPISRALRTGKILEASGYRYTRTSGDVRVLDVTAVPRPGGAAVIFRDRTASTHTQTQAEAAQARQAVLQTFCHRLGVASDLSALTQATVESARELLPSLPSAQAELYTHDPNARTLTRQAALPPPDRDPKRPRTLREMPPLVVPFDASHPLHWQTYVARQPQCDIANGNAVYTLPLIAHGAAIGHLTVTCSDVSAFDDAEHRAVLGIVASVAALALAGPLAAAQTAYLAAQVEAVRLVIRAVAAQTDFDTLADLIVSQVPQVVGAALCTVAVREGEAACLRGNSYRDALLRPERHVSTDPALLDNAAKKALKTGKTVQKIGLANPAFELGVWSALAGQSGRHSVLAVPLTKRAGVITVYTQGASGFSEAQISIVETLAMLFPANFAAAPSEPPS